jgi:MFS family permease
VWSSHLRTLTVGLVMSVTLVASEQLAVATVLPRVARDLHGHTLYGWVFSAFILGSLVGTVVAGQQVDRAGPAPAFTVGASLFAVGLVIGGLAQHMPVLVAGRAVQGFGAGAVPAVAYAVIGRAYPDALRPRMFAILSTAWVVPGLAGPALAGLVSEHFGWRAVFLGLLPLVAIAVALTVTALRGVGAPTVARPAPSSRTRLAIVLAVGTAVFLTGSTSHRPAVAFPLAALGLAIAFRPLRRLLPPGTLQGRPGLPAAIAMRGLNNFAFFGADAFVPLALTRVRHQSTLFGGAALTAATLTWTAGAWIQARFINRIGARRLVREGLGLIVVGVTLALVTLSSAVPAALGIVAWAIAGLGMGLAYAPISLVVLREAPEGEEGTSSASMQLADNLGVALGTGLGGAAIAYGEIAHWAPGAGIAIAFGLALAVAVVGAVASSGLPGPEAVEQLEHLSP